MNPGISIQHFTVSMAGQRVYFELKIPNDCDHIESVYASVSEWDQPLDFTPNSPPFSAGQVKLQWNELGDVFYASEVDLDLVHFPDALLVNGPVLPNGLDKGLWHFGKRIHPLNVCIPQGNTNLFGLYQDQLNFLKPKGSPDWTYKVHVYLICKKGGVS